MADVWVKGATAGYWRRFHNYELHDLCFSFNITRIIKTGKMRQVVNVACIVEDGGLRGGCAYRILVGKPEGKRPF